MHRRASGIIGGLCLLGGTVGCSAPQTSAAPVASEETLAAAAPLPAGLRAPSPGKGRIRLAVTPLEAEIALDGVTQGLGSDLVPPAFLELEPGTHRIEVRLAGFETYRAEVYVSAEVTETIPVKLRRLPAMPQDPDDKDKESSR